MNFKLYYLKMAQEILDSAERRRRIAEETYPRLDEEVKRRIDYIRNQIATWRTLLANLTSGIDIREGKPPIDEIHSSSLVPDRETLDHLGVSVRDFRVPVTDEEVEGFYHFFKDLDGRGKEFFKLLGLAHSDHITKKREGMIAHMERIQPFYDDILVPLMRFHQMDLSPNVKEGLFYYPILFSDIEHQPSILPIDSEIEQALIEALGGEIEPADERLEDDPKDGFTHFIILGCERPEGAKKNRIYLSIRIQGQDICKMRAKYSEGNIHGQQLARLLAAGMVREENGVLVPVKEGEIKPSNRLTWSTVHHIIFFKWLIDWWRNRNEHK